MSERKRKRKFKRFPVQRSIYLERDLYEFVKQFANNEGLVLSAAVRKLLRIARETIENAETVDNEW